jgi:DNA repair exonuclease SbcCD nuclease subunit
MKNCKELRIAEASDIHLGHPNTPTSHILASLRRAFPDNAETAGLDIIFLAGDVFDRQLSLPDEEVYEIRLWITELLLLCKKHDIVLRVLEGTPSHDWTQSKLFTHLNRIASIEADVQYVNVLSIERNEKLGIDILYIPDEWRPRCEETWHEVVALLKRQELKQVDYVVMHGAFPHQLPKSTHGRIEMHNPDNYLSITRKYVFVGHVHLHSQYERILAAGSFDRLVHGEEGAKGHIRVVARESGVDDIVFVRNPFAKTYLTIACEGLDEQQVREKVENAILKLREDSFIRLRCRKQDAAMALLSHFANKYTQFRWSVKEIGDKQREEQVILVDNRHKLSTIRITKDNVEELLMARIKPKHPMLSERCSNLLQETLNE